LVGFYLKLLMHIIFLSYIFKIKDMGRVCLRDYSGLVIQ
jgi:hypothetical protein